MTDPFRIYLHSLQTALAAGNATEHTHRPTLKDLIEALEAGITATNEPRQVTECGKPDMAVYRGPVLLGYLETKDVGITLDPEEKGPQLKRYYQVCHKWLKDRKGRTFSFEDLHHYQKIVVALAETIRLMAEIDATIEARGGWPIS